MINNNINNECILTVKCICYNHEKYIEKCLDSILSQKTTYKYKIIIHDDVSTDNSRSIIDKYVNEYPDIVIPMYETENQYSKGKRIFNIMDDMIDTKYCCVCECDDYWQNDNKIQKQLDFMESHPEYSVCGHSFDVVDDNCKLLYRDRRYGMNDHEITIEDVIMNKDLPQTATLLYRQDIAVNEPEFFNQCLVGDYPLMLYLATHGKMYYFDDNMTCYRRHNEGSWVTMAQKNKDYFKRHIDLLIDMLLEYKNYSSHKYDIVVNNRIDQLNFMNLKNTNDIIALKNNAYFKKLSISHRYKVLLELQHPIVFKKLQTYKRKIKNRK